MFALEEKQVPYSRCFINLAAGETSSEWYIKTVNPRGQVRTFIREGGVQGGGVKMCDFDHNMNVVDASIALLK